ncbi:PepSY domain-containing protein [Nostoc sp.]|uniref:PepSY domain-containing protein n=1 Tax=Nostoc sp. TaxID=1180 RepID=UPI002FFA8D0E
MKSKPIRNWIFIFHRYLGLALGLILIIVGLTGSLLVFDDEINQWSDDRQFGTVTPIGETL